MSRGPLTQTAPLATVEYFWPIHQKNTGIPMQQNILLTFYFVIIVLLELKKNSKLLLTHNAVQTLT